MNSFKAIAEKADVVRGAADADSSSANDAFDDDDECNVGELAEVQNAVDRVQSIMIHGKRIDNRAGIADKARAD